MYIYTSLASQLSGFPETQREGGVTFSHVVTLRSPSVLGCQGFGSMCPIKCIKFVIDTMFVSGFVWPGSAVLLKYLATTELTLLGSDLKL